MTLPMRLRDTFAQRILAFCRLSLERIYVKKGSFHRAAPSLFLTFEPLRKRKTGAFSFKINKFLQRDSYVFREYTYSLLSELFCSR